MPPSVPQVDEHGFPIPATFDDPSSPRRPSRWWRYGWQVGLVLAFVVLLAGWVFKEGLGQYVNAIIADQLLERAQQKRQFGDVPGALADLERASRWAPDRPEIHLVRAHLKLKTHDFEGSLADCDQAIRLDPQLAWAYASRSLVYQRLNRHEEAIEDLTKVISMKPKESMPYNNRAYFRAIAGIELDEALVDVQRAIDLIDQEIAAVRDADQEGRVDHARAQRALVEINYHRATYLDTRGYIRFLLGKYGPALEDLSEAIELSAKWRSVALAEAPRARHELDEELSVMYHHRGQALEKLGRHDEAQSDLDQGDKLGYNPAEGVF